MRRPLALLCAAALAASLAACGERPQTAQASSGKRSDTPAWQGATNPYLAGGWKPGDATSWEQHMRQRTQGQNDYARAN